MGNDKIDKMPSCETNAGLQLTIVSLLFCVVDDDFDLFQVWDGTSDALITFNRADFVGDVAYIVENDVLLYAIEKEIRKSANVTIQNNSRIEQVRLACDGHYNNKVYLKSGEVFSAELLVSK